MADPARQLVIDNLKSTLEGIRTTVGSKTHPVEISRTVKDWHHVGKGSRAWLGIKPEREQHSYKPFGIIEAKLTAQIVGHVRSENETDRAEQLNGLLDDVIAAIGSNTRLGGNAICTKVLQSETDEGDPDAVDSRGHGGSMVVVVEIFYERTTGAS